MSPPGPFLARLPRRLPWSNTRRAWLERLSVVAVLAAVVVVLVAYAGILDPWQQVLAWAVLLLVAAVLFRHDWLKLFGPIPWYDLVRTSRHVGTHIVRGGYLAALLAVLGVMFLNEWPRAPAGRLLPSQIALFAREFCYTFLITQYVLMLLLAPAFTAGAVAEERQKKTIQYLLVTDLRNHEIVLGKLASRIAQLGLLLLAGLPVLGALEFLGGVDPHLVLAAFAATAVTMASAAGVGILASVVARPARAAVLLAYGVVVVYVLLCWMSQGIEWWMSWHRFTAAAPPPPGLDGVLAVIDAGNPVVAVSNIFNSDPIEPALLRTLGAYTLFHGAVALATTATASVLLRWAALREPRPAKERTATPQPPVGDRPVLWREVHADRGPARRWGVILAVGMLIALSLAPVLREYYAYFTVRPWTQDLGWRVLQRYLGEWVRVAGAFTGCLLLLGVAIHAAYSIRVERERHTLDSLLTSLLTSEEILYGKWLASILSVRRLLPWLAVVWGVGVLAGGLHPAAVPLLALTWCVYAAAMAGIGLWFSLVSRTSLRAVLHTLLAVLGLSLGHWLIWIPCGFAFYYGRELEFVALFQGGLTPPAVMGFYLSFGYERGPSGDLFGKLITFAMVGNVLWGVFAWMVWRATNQRFKRDGGRADSGAIRQRTPPPRRLS